jgi:hypothetical protein
MILKRNGPVIRPVRAFEFQRNQRWSSIPFTVSRLMRDARRGRSIEPAADGKEGLKWSPNS